MSHRRLAARGSRAVLPRALTRADARAAVTVTALSLALTICTAASGAVAAAGRAATSGVSQATARTVCAEPSQASTAVSGSRQAAKTPPPAAVIRVDQVGYPSSAPKRAEIMTTSSRPRGIGWVLVRAGSRAGPGAGSGAGSCEVAAAGIARHDLGSWSKRYGWV